MILTILYNFDVATLFERCSMHEVPHIIRSLMQDLLRFLAILGIKRWVRLMCNNFWRRVACLLHSCDGLILFFLQTLSTEGRYFLKEMRLSELGARKEQLSNEEPL